MAYTQTRSPGSASNVNDGGNVAWSNPGNVVSSNNSRASCTINRSIGNQTSQLLRCTSFGFAIPSHAIIRGMEVLIEGSRSDSDDPVTTSWTLANASGGTVETGTATFTVGSEGTTTNGSPTNMNDNSPRVAAAILNASGMRIDFKLNQILDLSGTETVFQIDHIQLRVSYDLPGDPGLGF